MRRGGGNSGDERCRYCARAYASAGPGPVPAIGSGHSALRWSRLQQMRLIGQLVAIDIIVAAREVLGQQRPQRLDAAQHRRLGLAGLEPLLDRLANTAPLLVAD